MRAWLILLPAFLLLAALPGCAADQPAGPDPVQSLFEVVFDPARDIAQVEAPAGQQGLWFSIKFKIIRRGGAGDDPGKEYKAVVYHDNHVVARLDVPEPKLSEDLSAMLAVDISGSMAKNVQGNKENKKRIDQARVAAKSFVDRLPPKADCGLILFDHEIRLKEDTVPPSRDRKPLLNLIDKMEPRGGTAYLDATQVGIQMLVESKNVGKGRDKAVVVMTDGIDLNSTAKLDDVIDHAKKAKIKVHTIGIGEPAKGTPVFSVLVLDHSQSMEQRADDAVDRAKIQALHVAAERFVTLMPEAGTNKQVKAATTILPFGSKIGVADNFSNNKPRLIQQIRSLRPEGETAMLDAAYDAIATLEAAGVQGHKHVVVMTDGIDNMSRHRREDVIKRAKDADISVHMLAFGRESELKQAKEDMEQIARETGGSFHHARNEQDLIRIFEDMSNALHDDGIDEFSLKRLAKETGGKYEHARDINKLKFILDKLSDELSEKVYPLTIPAPHGYDGSAHKFAINLESGGRVVTGVTTEVAVRGVVIAEMNPFVYLGFLGVLVLLLAVPAALGRMLRSGS